MVTIRIPTESPRRKTRNALPAPVGCLGELASLSRVEGLGFRV